MDMTGVSSRLTGDIETRWHSDRCMADGDSLLLAHERTLIRKILAL
jgi:hypothetical protein